MAFGVRILADSLAPSGKRLTTWELTYPRCIHSEIMTHGEMARNAASSRAIPVEKMIERVMKDPFVPVHWGKNKKGMQAEQELTAMQIEQARSVWLGARNSAVERAQILLNIGLHKQITNRLLEPWMWITVILSGTSFTNWFGLRDHKDAEPHFQILAREMHVQYDAATPESLDVGEWHRPLFNQTRENHEDTDAVNKMARTTVDAVDLANKISVGRCARVSYLTHDGKRDIQADIDLHDRLKNANPGHWSPFEHVARAESDPNLRSGRFQGWTQYRKMFTNEYIGGRMP